MSLGTIAMNLTQLVPGTVLARAQTELVDGKIKTSEIPEMFSGSFIVSARSSNFTLFSERESPEINSPSINGYPCNPPCMSVNEFFRDAFVSTFTISTHAMVSSVLGSCAFTKVLVSIIERVTIDMIDLYGVIVGNSHDDSVHESSTNRSIWKFEIGFGVEVTLIRIPRGVPCEFIQFIETMRAYFYRLTLAKWNLAVFFIWGLHCALLESVEWIGRYQRPDPFILSPEGAI